jgi:hypothetical protein
MTRNISIIITLFFLGGREACGQINSLKCDYINHGINYINKSSEENFVEFSNGEKIHGKTIVWATGLLAKHEIEVDKKRYRIKETIRLLVNGISYYRVGNRYAKQIIKGTSNLYFLETFGNSPGPNGSSMRTQGCRYFVQSGENGDLKELMKIKDFKKYVSKCSESAKMLNKSNAEIRKEIRKNNSFLNNVFIVYCKCQIK